MKLCNIDQLRQLKGIIDPVFQRDFISQLPREMAFNILSFVPALHLRYCAGVSRTWRALCEDELLWAEKCRAEGIETNLCSDIRLPLGGVTDDAHNGQSIMQSTWKLTYLYHHRVRKMWREGKSVTPTELYNHGQNFITSMAVTGNRILTGSEDTTVRVVDLENAGSK